MNRSVWNLFSKWDFECETTILIIVPISNFILNSIPAPDYKSQPQSDFDKQNKTLTSFFFPSLFIPRPQPSDPPTHLLFVFNHQQQNPSAPPSSHALVPAHGNPPPDRQPSPPSSSVVNTPLRQPPIGLALLHWSSRASKHSPPYVWDATQAPFACVKSPWHPAYEQGSLHLILLIYHCCWTLTTANEKGRAAFSPQIATVQQIKQPGVSSTVLQ